jgi:hypothetical protein
MRFEFRVGWGASSNASFRGISDWTEFGGEAESVEEVEQLLERSSGAISDAMEEVLNASSFEWWLEVREVGSDD